MRFLSTLFAAHAIRLPLNLPKRKVTKFLSSEFKRKVSVILCTALINQSLYSEYNNIPNSREEREESGEGSRGSLVRNVKDKAIVPWIERGTTLCTIYFQQWELLFYGH